MYEREKMPIEERNKMKGERRREDIQSIQSIEQEKE